MENENQNDDYQKTKSTKGRKPKVNPAGDTIEKVVSREEIVNEVSYSAGKKLKEKKQMSEKQQANITKLIAMNAERKKCRDEEKVIKMKEDEKKANEVLVKTIVRPKRPYMKKIVPETINHSVSNDTYGKVKRMSKKLLKEFEPYPDDESEEQETTDGGQTTGDEVVKVQKYVKRIAKINKVLSSVPEKPIAKKTDYGDLMRVLF